MYYRAVSSEDRAGQLERDTSSGVWRLASETETGRWRAASEYQVEYCSQSNIARESPWQEMLVWRASIGAARPADPRAVVSVWRTRRAQWVDESACDEVFHEPCNFSTGTARRHL